MRNTVERESVTKVTEEALFLAGEVVDFTAREGRLLRFLDAEEELDRADVAAARALLATIQQRNAQKAEVRAQVRADFAYFTKEIDIQARILSAEATKAGWEHAREDLLAEGALKRIVAARKARMPELSQSEAEAI